MPYAPGNTARLYLDYIAIGRPHTLIFRFGTDAAAVAAAGVVQSLAEALAPRMYTNTVFEGLRYSVQGVDVSNPLPFTAVPGTGGTAGQGKNAPRYLAWFGRTTLGTRVRWNLYGFLPATDVPNDYRFQDGDDVNVDALDEDMRSFIEEMGIVAVDQQIPILKSYVNTGYNAYHQRKQRG